MDSSEVKSLDAFKWISPLLVGCALCFVSCKKASAVSAEKSKATLANLAKSIETDVGEVRTGLPQAAPLLAAAFAGDKRPADDAAAAKELLQRARGRVQDLRVAKSTFFALVDPAGLILRTDRDQDSMAGKNMFEAFPELKLAATKYVETRGSMPEASEVRGRGDGQWVAGTAIMSEGQLKGIYATGWSWSAYAYRLENAARSSARSDVAEGGKLPLLYVYITVADNVYGAPISPDVNARIIKETAPISKVPPTGVATFEVEITGRDFGLAIQRTPALGNDVAVSVLRSET
jgi:hypothetical protein